MEASTVTLLVLCVLFISTFTRSTLGFGDALIAMPLLTLLVGVRTATPVVGLAASTISLLILLANWRQVDLKVAWRLILATLLGIPVGLAVLQIAPEPVVKAILGAVLILFGIYYLTSPRIPVVKSGLLAYLFGFVAGILGGAYNTNGPPVVIYGTLQRWSPERFRATLQGYFFPTGLLILAGHAFSGLWTRQVFTLFGAALPLILLAVFLGGKLNHRLPAGRFDRLVYLALVVFGMILIRSAF